MAPIVDVVCYNGEPIMETRLRYLDPIVDLFVIVEAPQTFAGRDKDGLFVDKNKDMFAPYADKIMFLTMDILPPSDITDEHDRQRPWGREDRVAWARQRQQRDVAINALVSLKSSVAGEYIAFVGDVDEIPRNEALMALASDPPKEIVHLEMAHFQHDVRHLRAHSWTEAFVIPSSLMSVKCSLTDVRLSHPAAVMRDAGFHCSKFFVTPEESSGSSAKVIATPPSVLEQIPPELGLR